MADFTNKKEIQKAVEGIATKATQSSVDNQAIYKSLMAEIQNINPELGGFEELGMLLGLSEDQFAFIAPVFLGELEKSFNNMNDRMGLVQALNASGMKAEDLRDQYIDLIDQIDTTMADVLSSQKRDFLRQLLSLAYNAVAETEGIAKRVLTIPIEVISDKAKIPTYAHLTDAGMDVYALEDITIAPGETKLIPIGIKVALPVGYELQVRPKSGRSLNSKLRIANTPGTIDSGYRDEIGVIVENIDPPIRAIKIDKDVDTYIPVDALEFGQSYTIGAGEKFAQLVLSEVPKANFYTVESISSIGENRGGGFGSSGLK